MRKSQADKDVNVAVGSNIRRFREISGISQKKLAAAIGVTFQQVQKYESGKDRISARKLVETARALGCDFNSLFAGIEIGDVILAFPDHSTAALKASRQF
ncbi:XRE family transcriptional regulator [Sinorhizobium meliloti]|nr:helix-turn-helix transcriptional regulator [Sinorhizobium meliloti]RVJ85507.1 XRE family transcriptional regulator [Sinorhizobium meliloti]